MDLCPTPRFKVKDVIPQTSKWLAKAQALHCGLTTDTPLCHHKHWCRDTSGLHDASVATRVNAIDYMERRVYTYHAAACARRRPPSGSPEVGP